MAADGVRAVLLTAMALLPWSKLEVVGTSYRGAPPDHTIVIGRLSAVVDLSRSWLVLALALVVAASVVGTTLLRTAAQATSG